MAGQFVPEYALRSFSPDQKSSSITTAPTGPDKSIKTISAASFFQRNSDTQIIHHSDYNSELLVYIVDENQNDILDLIKDLRKNHFLTKNFNSLTKSMMNIKEDHPDVIILSAKIFDYTKFNIVHGLANSKLPIPVIILDDSFTKERMKGWLQIGIKTVISNSQDLDLIVFKATSHAREYRSQKLLVEALSLAIYELGVINHPGQNLLPEKNLEELQTKIKLLMKAKKSFTDFG